MSTQAGGTAHDRAMEPARVTGAASWPMRYYMLFVLMLVSAMSIIDRRIIEILVEPIKRDLALTDAEIGFMGGLPFALVYATLCIPAARLGDRWSRGKVVAIAISFWSAMTVLCGVAQNFIQLCFARLGVGAGEACGTPSAHALLSDLFPRKGRATAMSLHSLAVPLGTSLGLLVGGWASETYDWRTAFLIVGIPGLILGPVILLTFPKVPKGMADGVQEDLPPPPFMATMKELWAIRTLPYLILGAMLQTFIAAGMQYWVPAFMERTHHISGAELGAGLAAAVGTGSLIGHIAGGPVIDLLGRWNVRLQMIFPILCVLAGGACAAGAFAAPLDYVYLLLALQIFFNGMWSAPLYAITLTLAPAASRATAAALLIFAFNIFGLGLGPWFLGIVSTSLEPSLGEDSLRTTLLSATVVAIPAALLYFRASLTYPADIAAAEERSRTQVAS